jgi:saccharopine dehydrogenase (NAD+, L-lysine-forming)
VRAAILGAGGIVAPAIVRDLAESAEVDELLLLDLDPDRARAAAEAHGGDKASAAGVDARSGGLRSALATTDVLVNAASYRVNLHAMRAALEAGCHYVDLGGLYWLTGDQLELDLAFREAGLLALLGMGSSPGKTNVMARQAVRELDDAPDRIDVYAAGRDLDPPPGVSFPYSPRTLVDELTLAPVVIRNGGRVEVEPLTDGGELDFPEPIGRSRTIYTLHSEVRTFPSSFGCRDCSFRLSLSEPVLEHVRVLVGASEEEVEAAARTAAPSSARTVSVHVVEAARDELAVRVTAVTSPMAGWGLGGGVVSTAAPAAAAVRLLARGRIIDRGVLPPERCIEPEDLFPELERRSCAFSTSLGATGVKAIR